MFPPTHPLGFLFLGAHPPDPLPEEDSHELRWLAPSPRGVIGEAGALGVDGQSWRSAVQPRLEEVHLDDIIGAVLHAGANDLAQPDLYAQLVVPYAPGGVFEGFRPDARGRGKSPGPWKLVVIVGPSYQQDS